VTPADHDIKSEAEGVLTHGGFPVEIGDQAVTRFFIGSAIKNGIERQQRVAGKIHLGDKASGEGRTEHREVNMRGTPGVVMIAPRIRTGTNSDETEVAMFVGQGMTAPLEIGIERSIVLINAVTVAAGSVSLPDFNERVRNWATVFVEDASTYDNAFTERLTLILLGEIAGFDVDHGGIEERARDFRESVRDVHQWSGGRALYGRQVRAMQVFGLRAGIGAPIAAKIRHRVWEAPAMKYRCMETKRKVFREVKVDKRILVRISPN
jgi:hypothetical protein